MSDPHPQWPPFVLAGARLAPLIAWSLVGCASTGPDLPPAPLDAIRTAESRASIERPAAPQPGAPARREQAPIEPVFIPEASPDEVARVQVFLDRLNFSPGCIDGRWGPQTRAALRAWQQREGLADNGNVDEALRARLPSIDETFTAYKIRPEDEQALGSFPSDWRERAALDRLAHATLLELIAERFHATERAIKEWNPDCAWPNPPVGTTVRAPRVEPALRVRAARLEIDLSEKYLQAFDDQDRLIAHFPCSIAREVAKRPVGELRIVKAAENPNYTFDPSLFAEDPIAAAIGRRLIIPPGPNNPVGVVWLSLDPPGYGIHGTPAPEDIGKTESHGCFRLANWNARKLYRMISIGIPVRVRE